jgi:hypothetical protein
MDRLSDLELGRRVRAGLDKGRQRAITKKKEAGARTAMLVLALVQADTGPRRGLAGRIACELHGRVSERRVLQILEALSSGSGSFVQNIENARESHEPKRAA